MVALVQALVDILAILLTFVQDYLLPATAADINLIHVAIWLPVILGILAGVVVFFKGMWAKKKTA